MGLITKAIKWAAFPIDSILIKVGEKVVPKIKESLREEPAGVSGDKKEDQNSLGKAKK
jgi:hypothetical protein